VKKLAVTYFTFLILSLIISSCSKSDNSVATGETDNSNYFPSQDGTYYKYNVEKTDSNNAQSTGTRDSRCSNTSERGGEYTKQTDSVTLNGSTEVYTSLFRKTDAGVYYFLDTTGFAASLSSSFSVYVPFLTIDQEMLSISYPLQSGKTWTAFKVVLNYQGLVLNVVDVDATYTGKENVTLNLNSGTVTKEAAKIKYSFSLITNPLTQTKQTVTAYGWYVADVGAVKWQGNGLLLDAFTRGEINFADSTSTSTETLVDYSVQ
jgi:hypothetical protein